MTNLLVSSSTGFAFKLFAELTKSNIEQNVFISPTSVALALALAYSGARGETARAIARTLELGEISLDALNSANAALIESLRALDPHVVLAIANSLWAQQGISFAPDFLKNNQECYGAEIATLDFGTAVRPPRSTIGLSATPAARSKRSRPDRPISDHVSDQRDLFQRPLGQAIRPA